MDDAALQGRLLRLFARHEVDLEPDEDGWLLTDGDFPVIRAHWRPGTAGEPGAEACCDRRSATAREARSNRTHAAPGRSERAGHR